jgi:hypothetical protein
MSFKYKQNENMHNYGAFLYRTTLKKRRTTETKTIKLKNKPKKLKSYYTIKGAKNNKQNTPRIHLTQADMDGE